MTARERTVDQDGVVPVSVVVQLVSPTVNDTWAVLVGATASMSGATSEDANASASPARQRRRRAEPSPHAAAARGAPGRDHEHVGAELVDLLADVGPGAVRPARR